MNTMLADDSNFWCSVYIIYAYSRLESKGSSTGNLRTLKDIRSGDLQDTTLCSLPPLQILAYLWMILLFNIHIRRTRKNTSASFSANSRSQLTLRKIVSRYSRIPT